MAYFISPPYPSSFRHNSVSLFLFSLSLCTQVGERKELCGRGRDHLSSYADQSEPLSLWLRAAEERLQNLGPFPRSKEMLFEKKEELEVRPCFSRMYQHEKLLFFTFTYRLFYAAIQKASTLIHYCHTYIYMYTHTQSFLQDVVSHGDDLESLEKKSSEFLSSAKVRKSPSIIHSCVL